MADSLLITDLDILRRVSLARAHKALGSRAILECLLIEPSGPEHVVVVATNGFIAAWARVKTLESHNLQRNLIIPGELVKVLAKAKPRKSILFPSEFGLKINHGEEPGSSEFRLQLQKDAPTQVMREFPVDPRNSFPKWRMTIPQGEIRQDLSALFGSPMIATAEEILGEDGNGNTLNFRQRAITSNGHTHWAVGNGVCVGLGSMRFCDGNREGAREAMENIQSAVKSVEVANG